MAPKRKANEISIDPNNPIEYERSDLKKFKQNIKTFKKNIQDKDHPNESFLNSQSFESIECGGAGNCLFLSISHQLPKTSGYTHLSLRKKACNYLKKKFVKVFFCS